jgi:hypothetical protein
MIWMALSQIDGHLARNAATAASYLDQTARKIMWRS